MKGPNASPKWQTLPLGQIIQLEYGKPLPDGDRKPDGRYPVYGANGEKDRTDRHYWDKPSIIVGRKGSAGEVNLTEPKFWPLDVTYFVTFDERKYDLRFLYNLLTLLDLPSLAKGVKPGINRNEVYEKRVPVPPLPEQQRIVGILDEAFAGIATAKANAEKNLRNARQVFECELEVIFVDDRAGWQSRPLRALGVTQTGSTPKTSERRNYGDHIPFVKPADFLSNGTLDYGNDALSTTGLACARLVPAGSVLIVCIGATIGKCGFTDRDVTTNQQINALIPNGSAYHRFIYYQMLTKSFQARVMHGSGQATLPIINKGKWSELKVSLPESVAEQRLIASRLDALCRETQRLATLYQQKLAALDALKKSLLHQAFSGQLCSGTTRAAVGTILQRA